MNDKIEALHEFHDPEYAQQWADRFKPSSERMALFELIYSEVNVVDQDNLQILELGIGPGYLAEYLLSRLPDVSYQGLDFSQPMLEIARQRLIPYRDRIHFSQADLTSADWTKILVSRPNVVVTTWALHDLFNRTNIGSVYDRTFQILLKGGVFINGDFIQPENSETEYEGGRLRPSQHLDLLRRAGFLEPKCLAIFEENVQNPTTANNYMCFFCRKPV